MTIRETAIDITATIMEEVEKEYGCASSTDLLQFVRDTIETALRDSTY